LKWTPAPNAALYQIYVGQRTGSVEATGVNMAYPSFVYTDDLQPSTEYTFYITALNSVGEGPSTGKITVKTNPLASSTSGISTPTLYSSSSDRGDTMTVSWWS